MLGFKDTIMNIRLLQCTESGGHLQKKQSVEKLDSWYFNIKLPFLLDSLPLRTLNLFFLLKLELQAL